MARILAVMALVIAAIVVIVVVSSSLGGDDEGSEANRPAEAQKQEMEAKYYVVEPGDTFAGIAAEHGISVPRLEELNPNLDTQLLPERACVDLVPEGCKILAEGG